MRKNHINIGKICSKTRLKINRVYAKVNLNDKYNKRMARECLPYSRRELTC